MKELATILGVVVALVAAFVVADIWARQQVAQWLPEALELEQVVVRDEQLIVTIGASKQILDEATLATLGSCEA